MSNHIEAAESAYWQADTEGKNALECAIEAADKARGMRIEKRETLDASGWSVERRYVSNWEFDSWMPDA